MKTTLDIPDALLRRMKARAAGEGRSMRAFAIEAIQRQLAESKRATGKPPWQRHVGRVSDAERTVIDAAIQSDCEQIHDEDW